MLAAAAALPPFRENRMPNPETVAQATENLFQASLATGDARGALAAIDHMKTIYPDRAERLEAAWIAAVQSTAWSWTPPHEPGPGVRRVRPAERYAGDNNIWYDREPDNSGWRLVISGREGDLVDWLQVVGDAGKIYGGRTLLDATAELAAEEKTAADLGLREQLVQMIKAAGVEGITARDLSFEVPIDVHRTVVHADLRRMVTEGLIVQPKPRGPYIWAATTETES